MPRSTAMKSAGISCEGVHKLIDCPFCDKKHMRSDHFPAHLEVEMKRHDVSTAIEMQAKFDDFDLLGDIMIKQVVSGPTRKFPYGICFECNKYIANKESLTQTVFEEHVCKAKKIAEKENAKKAPKSNSDEMKDLFVSIKTGVKMTERQKNMLEDCKEVEDTYADTIHEFVYKLCKVSAVAATDLQKELISLDPTLENMSPGAIVNHFKKFKDGAQKKDQDLAAATARADALQEELSQLRLQMTQTEARAEHLAHINKSMSDQTKVYRDVISDNAAKIKDLEEQVLADKEHIDMIDDYQAELAELYEKLDVMQAK